MGLFDKIKNFFYDEEEIVVTKKNSKEEPKVEAKPVEQPKTEKVEPEETAKRPLKENVDDVVSERELFKMEPTFKFPVIFEEEDFVEEKKKNHSINVLDRENNKIRNERTAVSDEQKSFRPSPIISPVYGVLDKNYKKDDVTVKEDSLLNLYDGNKKVDIDKVIEKAYGRYKVEEDEPKAKEISHIIKEKDKDEAIDLFRDIKDENIDKRKKKETMPKKEIADDEEDNYVVPPNDDRLRTIDELLENTNEQDFYALVDSMYKNDDEEDSE